MSFKSKNTKDDFSIAENLNSQSSVRITPQFVTFAKEIDHVILSLDKVSSVDPTGDFILEQLYLDFIHNNKIMEIIGEEKPDNFEVVKFNWI